MTTANKIILIFLTTIFVSISFGQTLKILKPTVGKPNNYSKQDQIKWQSALDQYSKINSGDLDYKALNAKDKALIDSLEMLRGPLTGLSRQTIGGKNASDTRFVRPIK
jgi:hypothetical protein